MEGSSLPLLVIYEDSLHNRWFANAHDGCTFRADGPEDVSRLHNGQRVPCGHSMQVQFNAGRGHSLLLHSDDPVMVSNSTVPLMISFAFALRPWPDGIPACPGPPSHGACNAPVCVALPHNGTGDQSTLFVPLCDADNHVGSTPLPHARVHEQLVRSEAHQQSHQDVHWRQFRVPLSDFGVAHSFRQLEFVTGSGDGPLSLTLDDVWLATERPPSPGDAPPSYGRDDINVIKSDWIEGVPRAGSANRGRSNRNPHFCEYMSSELAHARPSTSRPQCKMDGDHLHGRWMQTCDPRMISRPDHFAYGRALPIVQGWFDYRLCYRQSATERLRTLQALSWSWRPFQCALAPVKGDGFDQWLGRRTIVFLGDSLTAQSYYSLLWLIGGVVVEQDDLYGYAPEEVKRGAQRGEGRIDECRSTAGNEGGYVSRARLRSGGVLIKVMRHGDIVEELYKPRQAFWSRWLPGADFVVMNVGHHYHSVDPAFASYAAMTRAATRQLERMMKPSAHLIFRTTNIGHHSCETALRPLHSRREAWQQLSGSSNIWAWQPPQQGKNAVDLFKDKYNWRGPPLFEGAWADAARRTSTLGARFTFLNVSFLDARADGHVATSMRYSASTGQFAAKWKTEFPLDCLHYCYPGPSDYWALSLYNLLLNNPRFAHANP